MQKYYVEKNGQMCIYIPSSYILFLADKPLSGKKKLSLAASFHGRSVTPNKQNKTLKKKKT